MLQSNKLISNYREPALFDRGKLVVAKERNTQINGKGGEGRAGEWSGGVCRHPNTDRGIRDGPRTGENLEEQARSRLRQAAGPGCRWLLGRLPQLFRPVHLQMSGWRGPRCSAAPVLRPPERDPGCRQRRLARIGESSSPPRPQRHLPHVHKLASLSHPPKMSAPQLSPGH